MVSSNGRLSYIFLKNDRFLVENDRFLVENDRFSDRFCARGGSNDLLNDFFSVLLMKNFINTKRNLFPRKLPVKTVKLAKIVLGSLKLKFFPLWTVKLLFVIFGRLSYTFFSNKNSNLTVHLVYLWAGI